MLSAVNREWILDSILCVEVKSGFTVVPHNETGRKLHTAFHLSLLIQEKTNISNVAHPGFLGNDASGHAACKVPLNAEFFKKQD